MLNSKEDQGEEPASTSCISDRSSGMSLNSFQSQNEYFTSTPYHVGFYSHLPPITAIWNQSPYSRSFMMDPSSSLSTESTTDSLSSQLSPPPRLFPMNDTPAPNGGFSQPKKAFSSSLQSDSGISSASSLSSATSAGRSTVRGYKKTFCNICKMHINKEGKRSQGPRRHLLQYHVRRPLFQCPHCSHASFYDKFHVTSHMRRIHQDTSDRLINRSSEFDDEVECWYERCFGERKAFNANANKESTANYPSTYQPAATPPPHLSPEQTDRENFDPNSSNTSGLLMVTPLKAPTRKRKRGFTIEEILETSPKKSNIAVPLMQKLGL